MCLPDLLQIQIPLGERLKAVEELTGEGLHVRSRRQLRGSLRSDCHGLRWAGENHADVSLRWVGDQRALTRWREGDCCRFWVLAGRLGLAFGLGLAAGRRLVPRSAQGEVVKREQSVRAWAAGR